jgi:hypothetical protein
MYNTIQYLVVAYSATVWLLWLTFEKHIADVADIAECTPTLATHEADTAPLHDTF